jgi:predicted acylesterase/phospholipase RssA
LSLFAPEGSRPRRSLILAGGGMRVAYQAGVLLALEEEGLTFFHGDGTSGGTMNLAMLLSGHTPAEMCERWRTLNVRDFVSFLRIKRYLGSLNWPAFGGAEGLTGRVYPHLGIDVERIRGAQGIEGTFNVCDYGEKTNWAVPHREIDEQLLVAGVSLPMMMPPVARDGRLLLDSVWIKDANPSEAVRRGAEELWLVWCIGNTATYRPGAFNQYVHMIELSANGGLSEELAHLRAELGSDLPVLHVIKPEYPLPLDPDFYFGRIDASALIAMGYRDAKRYLAERLEGGVEWGPSATKMRDQPAGAAFVEKVGGAEIRVDIRDADGFFGGDRTGEAVAIVNGRPAKSGTFALDGRWRTYDLVLEPDEHVSLRVRAKTGRSLGVLRRLQATGTDSVRRQVSIVTRLARLLA